MFYQFVNEDGYLCGINVYQASEGKWYWSFEDNQPVGSFDSEEEALDDARGV